MEKTKPIGKWFFLAVVFTGASYLGGIFKIPSPVTSIALDSAPGYFLAAFVHPVLGGIVGCIGHLASAASGGFQLGFVHVYVAFQMFFWCLIFGVIARISESRWALTAAAIAAVVLNGAVGPILLGLLGVVEMSFAMTVVPFLAFASAANLLVASVAVELLKRTPVRKRLL